MDTFKYRVHYKGGTKKMSNFINKNFKKKTAVRVLIHYPDHRQKEFYVIPKANMVQIDKQTYTLDPENIFLYKRFPTYIFKYDNILAINPLNFDVPMKIDPKGLYQYAEAKGYENLMKAGGSMDRLFFISIGVSIMTLIGLIFMFTTLSDSIKEITEILNRIGG